MSRITITIDTDNAAFEGDNYHTEVARILKKIAVACNACRVTPTHIFDINGNRVGSIVEENDL